MLFLVAHLLYPESLESGWLADDTVGLAGEQELNEVGTAVICILREREREEWKPS